MTPPTDHAAAGLTGRRIVVAGTSGSGKSTLARTVAVRLGLPYTELDELFHGPDWQRRPEFEADVEALTSREAWIIDSAGYDSVRDLTWSRADTLIWLDFSRPVVMGRVLRRSVARATFDRELWNGNTEGFADWRDPEHPVRWAWATHGSKRSDTRARLADPRWAHLRLVHLRSPAKAREWLKSVGSVL
jgi:adenylate kinase family enzyme